MFNLDEEKIVFTFGNKALFFGRARKLRMLCFFISDAEISGIYLSPTLGTAKFKQLD